MIVVLSSADKSTVSWSFMPSSAYARALDEAHVVDVRQVYTHR